ncbi:MAG: 16S rRNA (cytidine(1402)-2'-O)-methyltransferase [Spirochaetaceae bacterium]|jgi:16S rRNA (cytidine1402-2'-O)-methyltransferase|nr:16S rRNA (cytidine(1402)-2'-O)-methyltransferase [Spirochaetaceae bacterium]
MAKLYIVATPIGNLADITLRAVDTLKSVQIIAAEDTRHTRGLLTHLGIRARLLSCRAHNEERAAEKILEALNSGEDTAFVTDAGTPSLSDPGAVLVRMAAEAGHDVIPVPGASAFSALLSVAGAAGKTVIFEGFLSPKSGRRRTRLKELLEGGAAFVLYESPFRVLKLFSDLVEFDSERYVCVGREMTKLYEEYIRGSAASVLALLLEKKEMCGEFAVFVSGEKRAKNC